jgi:leader peptidase (prepilin peptidase) / N-methyltransferase
VIVLIAVCLVLGLAVGSFLNVVVRRVPAEESVVRPGSHCPACTAPIPARDNVPVLSWLLLRGRARCCGAAIPVRYPLVEAGTAAAFAAVAAWLGASWALPAYLVLAAASIALALIDLDTFRLPFVIVVPTFAAGVVLLGLASVLGDAPAAAGRAVLGAAGLWLLYRVLHAINPRGMGYGDVRLAGVVGLYLAWLGWDRFAVGAFLGFLVGGLFGVLLIVAGRGGLKTQIPYGPYMLAGAWLAVAVGPGIATWYLQMSGL